MTDQDLLRYSRQIMLPQVGIEGQQTLLKSSVLLVGMGGLGAPTALYLAAAGVGHLIIADFDRVELSNLQRQIIHFTDDIGNYKVVSAKQKMAKINPDIKITTVKNLDEKGLDFWVKSADIVLDGTDNFAARFAINHSCITQKKPLVSAAVIRFEGQLGVFKGYLENQACYQCLYPQKGEDESCATSGILAPNAGVLGSLQATQALKVLLNLGEQLTSKLLLIDLLQLSFRKIKINKDKSCKICNLPNKNGA